VYSVGRFPLRLVIQESIQDQFPGRVTPIADKFAVGAYLGEVGTVVNDGDETAIAATQACSA
jgi:hypothetical protein